MINRLNIKESLEFMYKNTLDDRIKDVIELVNNSDKYSQFIDIISNGNDMKWLVGRAREEKMNFWVFMELVIINKYNEIIEKLGE